MGSFGAIVRRGSVGAYTGDQIRGLSEPVVAIAPGAAFDRNLWHAARIASLEIGETRFELRLEGGELLELLARFGELGGVDLAEARGGELGRFGSLLASHELLDLRERQAELLELVDPSDAQGRVRREEPVAS